MWNMFQANNKNTRTKNIMDVVLVLLIYNYEHISHLFLVNNNKTRTESLTVSWYFYFNF